MLCYVVLRYIFYVPFPSSFVNFPRLLASLAECAERLNKTQQVSPNIGRLLRIAHIHIATQSVIGGWGGCFEREAKEKAKKSKIKATKSKEMQNKSKEKQRKAKEKQKKSKIKAKKRKRKAKKRKEKQKKSKEKQKKSKEKQRKAKKQKQKSKKANPTARNGQ